jgi:hypothetical protein
MLWIKCAMRIVVRKKMCADIQLANGVFHFVNLGPFDVSFRLCTRFNVAIVAYAKIYKQAK